MGVELIPESKTILLSKLLEKNKLLEISRKLLEMVF